MSHGHTLYYAPGACSLSPHIALRETGGLAHWPELVAYYQRLAVRRSVAEALAAEGSEA